MAAFLAVVALELISLVNYKELADPDGSSGRRVLIRGSGASGRLAQGSSLDDKRALHELSVHNRLGYIVLEEMISSLVGHGEEHSSGCAEIEELDNRVSKRKDARQMRVVPSLTEQQSLCGCWP